MAHANVINNTLVDDDGQEIVAPAFTFFEDEIETLMAQRTRLPVGWHQHFDHAIASLRAVDCVLRYPLTFSRARSWKGSLRVEINSAFGDSVVQGILNKLAARTACTCEVCGRKYGAAYRQQMEQTLCSVCHAKRDLNASLELWLDKGYRSREYRNRTVIELTSLPANLQMLISPGKVKSLKLGSHSEEIEYITPEMMLAQKAKLEVMRRYLQHADVNRVHEAY